MGSDNDRAFLQILREEKNIINFLDAFFGFLYRCTDFYVESSPDQNLGFPPGVTEKLVLNSLRNWRNISKLPDRTDQPRSRDADTQSRANVQDDSVIIEDSTVPQVAHELEVETCVDSRVETCVDSRVETCVDSRVETCVDSRVETCVDSRVADAPIQSSREDRTSDSYNGAERENYTWSQTISDLDVLVKLPSCVQTAKELRVNLDSSEMKIEARSSTLAQNRDTAEACDSEWTRIFMGELCFKIRKDESVWSIVPGQHISIHLEKASDRWWEALIVGEPKIELSKIECSRHLDDMGSAEEMKVQELMWNHQQKLLGKPTSEQIKMEKILKKAWDAKGSPFEGTPYDPSIVQFP